MSHTIPFTKMHGLGNDYIYVNTMLHPIPHPSETSIRWSDRHTGIGGDGLVLIGGSSVADFSMRIFNADGSEAMMCGNASRCIGKYVYEKGLTSKTDLSLETLSGIKRLSLEVTDGKVNTVTVDMGVPSFRNAEQVLAPGNTLTEHEFTVDGHKFPGTYVCMGNPHLVIFTPDAEQVPVDRVGSQLEHHPFFPRRTNVEFASFLPDGSVRMRVWERGSGITRACGTGACATAVAAIATRHTGRLLTIRMDGGDLDVLWNEADSHVYMTGTATCVFEGTITL
ncbi:MAG: diaminopimelate epimerase [Bacteroidaceae bacterium]|nr:diaminopimelate epimerase [Bacteroidaceae bacterium]